MDTLDLKYRPRTYEEIIGQDLAKSQLQGDLVRSYILEGPSGVGKAQPLTSKIFTKSGYVNMGDVEVGQEILDGEGNSTKIVGVYPQGKRDIYKITLNDRTSYEVSDEHLNVVQYYHRDRKQMEEEVLTTLELIEALKKKTRVYRVPVPILDSWEEREIPLDPYLMGALIGDGSLTGSMKFSNSEQDVLNKVSNKLRELGHELVHEANHDYRIRRIKGEKKPFIRAILRDQGLNVKSTEKSIPQEYLYNSYNNRLSLFQGLFDTDGSIDKKGAVEYGTSSPKLASDMAFLARSLGIRVTKTSSMGRYLKNGKHVETTERYRLNMKIENGFPFYTSDKHKEAYTDRQNPVIRKIVSVEKVRKDLCQCIMVDSESHTYLTDNLTPTHNTTISRVFANVIKAEVIELDTASLGKADIEDLKQTAYYSPMFFERKVIILDEVHNLSKQAWESLLKVIEEGPDFTIWMLVTTEPNKVPKTIQTRSRRITFTKVKNSLIAEHLKEIVKKEGHEPLPDNIIHEIVAHADGGVREALKLLETYLTTGEIDVRTSQKDMISIIKAVYAQDYTTINRLTEEFSERELEMLIKVISDYITMIVLVKDSQETASPGNNVAYEILTKHTSINPTLLDDLRDMQMTITNTFEIAGTTQIEQTVNTLYILMDTLMRHYNMFHDKKATTRGALNWISSQLT